MSDENVLTLATNVITENNPNLHTLRNAGCVDIHD